MPQDTKKGPHLMRPDAAVSLPDGMSTVRCTQNSGLHYKHIKRSAHRVIGERQNVRYLFCCWTDQKKAPQTPANTSGKRNLAVMQEANELYSSDESPEP